MQTGRRLVETEGADRGLLAAQLAQEVTLHHGDHSGRVASEALPAEIEPEGVAPMPKVARGEGRRLTDPHGIGDDKEH